MFKKAEFGLLLVIQKEMVFFEFDGIEWNHYRIASINYPLVVILIIVHTPSNRLLGTSHLRNDSSITSSLRYFLPSLYI